MKKTQWSTRHCTEQGKKDVNIFMVICGSDIQSGSLIHDGYRNSFEVSTSTLPLVHIGSVL